MLELFSSPTAIKEAEEDISKKSVLVHKAFGINDGDNIVVANGRVFPLYFCISRLSVVLFFSDRGDNDLHPFDSLMKVVFLLLILSMSLFADEHD